MVSPAHVKLNRGAFLTDPCVERAVDRDAHRGESDLDELDLGAPQLVDAA
jgi:hypothetical protein